MSLTKSKKKIDLSQVGVVGLILRNVVVAGLFVWMFTLDHVACF